MMASSLIDLQRLFLARVRGQPVGDLSIAIASGRMSRDRGLGIYAYAYEARLRETLDHDHPVLGAYLGDELWDEMCRGYIAGHPSHYRSLRDFGTALPGYLAQAEPFRAHPEIAELAALERSLLDSFDAADSERTDWNQLLARPASDWPGLRLRFHPSFKLHRLARNSVEIWRAIKDGLVPPPASAAVTTDWALWRDVDRVSRFRSLDSEEHAAVSHFLYGGDFSGLCDLLLAWHPAEAVPQAALGHLRAWCGEDWVCRWD